MIESSITEEIKEENASDKSSSKKTSSTPNNHIVVQEPLNSMFQYSLGDTDQGTDRDVETPQMAPTLTENQEKPPSPPAAGAKQTDQEIEAKIA